MNLEKLNQYLDLNTLNITWTDAAEIVILSFIIYQVMIWIKSTFQIPFLKNSALCVTK